jgi:hypothetical protein
MPVIEDHIAFRLGIMPDHPGDQGEVPSDLEPHDHLHINQKSTVASPARLRPRPLPGEQEARVHRAGNCSAPRATLGSEWDFLDT